MFDPAGNGYFAVGTDHANYRVHWCEKLGYAPYSRNCEAKYGGEEAWAGTAAERLDPATDAGRASLEALLGAGRVTRVLDTLADQVADLAESREPGRRFTALRALGEARRLPVPPNRSLDELRNEAIACLLLSDLEVARQWSGFPPGTKSVGFDGTFTKYARQHVDNGEVSVHRVSDDRELCRLPGQGPANEYYRPELSEDGRFLEQWCAVQGEWRGRLWRIDGPQPILVQKAEHRAFAFSPDGRRLGSGGAGFQRARPGGHRRGVYRWCRAVARHRDNACAERFVCPRRVDRD